MISPPHISLHFLNLQNKSIYYINETNEHYKNRLVYLDEKKEDAIAND